MTELAWLLFGIFFAGMLYEDFIIPRKREIVSALTERNLDTPPERW